MFAALQSFVEWMGSDPLFVDEMIDKIGVIIEDYGPNALLKPRDSLFSAAEIVRCPGSTSLVPNNTPSHIILTPAEPPAIETLMQAFGEYQKLPNRKPFPPRVIFYLDLPGCPYTVALIAEVRQGLATKIILRRDKRY
jgi:hypothetical protein